MECKLSHLIIIYYLNLVTTIPLLCSLPAKKTTIYDLMTYLLTSLEVIVCQFENIQEKMLYLLYFFKLP